MATEDSCSGCENPCDFPKYPDSIMSKIDFTESMADSVSAHRFHFVILSGESYSRWWTRVEEKNAFVARMQETHKKLKEADESVPHMLLHVIEAPTEGLTDEERESKNVYDIMCFPDRVMYRKVKQTQIESLLCHVLQGQEQPELQAPEKLNQKAFLFVCGHKLRDKRCGVAGPILKEELHKQIDERKLTEEIDVHLISHVGGHKWAGNVIIYDGNRAAGQWYGRVMPKHAPLLIEQHIQQGEILKELWRGQMAMSENVKSW